MQPGQPCAKPSRGFPQGRLPADQARHQVIRTESTAGQYDFGNLLTYVIHHGAKKDSTRNRSGVTGIPNIAADPTIGFQVGSKAVPGRRLGTDPATLFSVAATSASITTKGIIYFYINHNIFTPGNKWNFQGNLVVAKNFSPDFGLGIYLDAGVRINQTWIGSTKNALQFTTDFRKYVSLSAANPETVLAFWNWGSYLLAGDIPYLGLPGTARDGSFRSGRAYTAQYFKGTQYNDTEMELRFPILKKQIPQRRGIRQPAKR